ncbi:MAG: nodulation protein NfeD [Chloroflexi bacterium]|nr:nodulation protein NfeD [Chloroflexota bacterium]
MRLVRLVGILVVSVFWLALPFVGGAATRHVDLVRLKGPINPVSAGFLSRAMDAAEANGAAALIVELNTPGGLDSSMREIVERMLRSKVPIVVYVGPSGARAASAGTFMAMAGHVVAMAPNTTMGAAHPVGGQGQSIEGDMAKKVTNDAAAYISTLARDRGRNAEWAERAVRESVVITDRDAVQEQVADLVAADLPGLLEQLDGREVTANARTVVLATRGAEVRTTTMNTVEDFLFAITDPNIAYLLLSLAMLGIWLELSTPGAVLPGVVGGIALLLALFGLGMLPVNYVGLLFMLFGFALFFAEVKIQSHGLLTIGGLLSFVLGSLMLVNSTSPYLGISLPLIGLVSATIAGFSLFVVGKAISALRWRPAVGQETLVGQVGIVRAALEPSGMILIQGERWQAESLDGPVAVGQPVLVTAVDGLRLKVIPQPPTPVARKQAIEAGRRPV